MTILLVKGKGKVLGTIYFIWGFLCGSAGKEPAWNAGDPGLISGLGRSPGEGKGYPFQYSGLENSMNYLWGRKGLDTTERLSLCILFETKLFLRNPSSHMKKW